MAANCHDATPNDMPQLSASRLDASPAVVGATVPMGRTYHSIHAASLSRYISFHHASPAFQLRYFSLAKQGRARFRRIAAAALTARITPERRERRYSDISRCRGLDDGHDACRCARLTFSSSYFSRHGQPPSASRHTGLVSRFSRLSGMIEDAARPPLFSSRRLLAPAGAQPPAVR